MVVQSIGYLSHSVFAESEVFLELMVIKVIQQFIGSSFSESVLNSWVSVVCQEAMFNKIH